MNPLVEITILGNQQHATGKFGEPIYEMHQGIDNTPIEEALLTQLANAIGRCNVR